jgi:hypothetical protein
VVISYIIGAIGIVLAVAGFLRLSSGMHFEDEALTRKVGMGGILLSLGFTIVMLVVVWAWLNS